MHSGVVKHRKVTNNYNELTVSQPLAGFVPALGSVPIIALSKNPGTKLSEKDLNPGPDGSVKLKSFVKYALELRWKTNSCVYDATLSVLFGIYCCRGPVWFEKEVLLCHQYLKYIGSKFIKVTHLETSLGNAHDQIHSRLT
jgi:hypothetical protein